jgi:hypothetical protein
MIVLLVFWSCEQIFLQSHLPALLKRRAWNRGIAIAICSLGCFVAAMNNTQNALNSYLEFAFIKAQIAGAKIGNLERIHIVQPRSGSIGFNGWPVITDEFNKPTTAYDFDIANLVRLALIELQVSPNQASDGRAWLAAAKSRATCMIIKLKPGQLRLTNEMGDSADADLRGNRLEVPVWRISGTISPDLMSIRWSNGTFWGRRDNELPLTGFWTVRTPGTARGELSRGATATVSVRSVSANRLLLTKDGQTSEATIDGSQLTAHTWNVSGILSSDLALISWSNGAIWERQHSDVMEGEWVMLDPYTTGAMVVTASPSNDEVVRTPGMLVIDMNALLDSASGLTDARSLQGVISRALPEDALSWFDENIAAARNGARAFYDESSNWVRRCFSE